MGNFIIMRPRARANLRANTNRGNVGGGVTSVYVRLCPVLFGFYETTDVVFGTLADIDGHWRTWTDIGGHRRTLADLDGH